MIRNKSLFLCTILLALALTACGNDPAKPTDDPTPRAKSLFVEVNGVTLHYLDWGGEGRTLLFLTGLGNSAHIFDDIAPVFAPDYHVLALTRRGHGESEKPSTGYDTGTLVEDIRCFLDELQIEGITLVGHSLAGDELTRFASLYPERIEQLIYLDAALDRADLFAVAEQAPYEEPSPGPEDVISLDAYRSWLVENIYGFWSPALETELRLQAEGHFTPPEVVAALVEGTIQSNPDYTTVQAPALGIYAVQYFEDILPQGADSAMVEATRTYYEEIFAPYFKRERDRFREEVVNGTVIEMPSAHHYVFIHKKEEVVRLMQEFLSEINGQATM